MLDTFLSGAISMAFLTIALFYVRFWRKTREPLFAFFAAAFAILTIERVLWVWWQLGNETQPYIYLMRLGAFLLIIIGVVQKNRQKG